MRGYRNGFRPWRPGIHEAYVSGVSTRRVGQLIRSKRMEGISKSEVSRICGELAEEVERFRSCPSSQLGPGG